MRTIFVLLCLLSLSTIVVESQDCRDKDRRCPIVAKKGFCNKFKLLNLCYSSCGMCCQDYDAQRCDQIRRRGTCAAESKFADNKCLKSCNKCKSDCRPCTDAQYSLHYKIEGFRVRAEVGTFHRWPKLAVALKEDLGKLKKVVPRPAALRLQHLSGIYVSKLKVCNTYPTCNDPTVADSYHVSRRWLAMNHDAPEKAGFVDMMNPGEYLVRRSNVEKYNLLHEFFHAWFDIRRRAAIAGDKASDLKVEEVKAAWRAARMNPRYQRVSYAAGGHRVAYALTSEWEYMGELSEAFFAEGKDRNDYYPYNRKDLKEFDPQGYRAIHGIWGPPYPSKVATAGTGA
ncbi:uncharacterized protein LOC5512488 isoform X2 [Nematostella vectensis]|uniref:uncharacterized protein LOC5512488 isoform X2 n=1 Tax=Nematostella vectensis TaxID=45351 RepID=UPI0020773BD0|nr:uncharacterized protein LOC5512488 isoform X2 [Nematostella vectensis]